MMKYYYEAEAFLKDLLERHYISDVGKLSAIENYINVAELEMAFEGAMLCYIDQREEFSCGEKAGIIRYGDVLKLNEESVLDDNFWKKINAYLFP